MTKRFNFPRLTLPIKGASLKGRELFIGGDGSYSIGNLQLRPLTKGVVPLLSIGRDFRIVLQQTERPTPEDEKWDNGWKEIYATMRRFKARKSEEGEHRILRVRVGPFAGTHFCTCRGWSFVGNCWHMARFMADEALKIDAKLSNSWDRHLLKEQFKSLYHKRFKNQDPVSLSLGESSDASVKLREVSTTA